jgi:hypothetical protein
MEAAAEKWWQSVITKTVDMRETMVGIWKNCWEYVIFNIHIQL